MAIKLELHDCNITDHFPSALNIEWNRSSDSLSANKIQTEFHAD